MFFQQLSYMQYSIIKYSHHAVHSITRTYLFCNWKFVPFDPLHPFLHCHHYLWQSSLVSITMSSGFLWLNNIPLCVYVCVCVCVCTHHIFSVCSSTDEHLDGFHVLAVINNTVVVMGVEIHCELVLLFSLDKIPLLSRSRIVRTHGSSIFNLISILFFHSVWTGLHSQPTNA